MIFILEDICNGLWIAQDALLSCNLLFIIQAAIQAGCKTAPQSDTEQWQEQKVGTSAAAWGSAGGRCKTMACKAACRTIRTRR